MVPLASPPASDEQKIRHSHHSSAEDKSESAEFIYTEPRTISILNDIRARQMPAGTPALLSALHRAREIPIL